MAFLFAVLMVMVASKLCTAEAANNDDLEQRMNEMVVTMEMILHDNHQLKADNQQLASKVAQLEKRLDVKACEFSHFSIN